MQNTLSLSDLRESNDFISKKSRFISHEIKNQLSVINLYTKIIEKKSDGFDGSTKTIFNAISNITNLLQELKTVSEIKIEEVFLNKIVEETVSEIKELATENNINLELDFENDFLVLLDIQKFKNVLLNLVKNAVEALKETEKDEKYIKISTVEIGNKISLRIENNGNKIDKKNQVNIFAEGFTTKKTGSGLGLCICKKTLSEQDCELKLLKSDKKQTVFEILINKIYTTYQDN